MRRLLAAAMAAGVLGVVSTAQQPAQRRTQARPPNIVFVLFEGTGAGWASTSVAMDDRLPEAKQDAQITPNLARLAAQGARFSDFYVSAPRCTPARATFLTGISAGKLRMTYVNESGRERPGGEARGGGRRTAAAAAPELLRVPASVADLPRQGVTIAEALQERGYATAHFGKWHVGRSGPGAHGFSEHDGANSNQGPGRNPKPNPKEGVAITERGIAFVKAQQAADRPFYLQLSHYGGGSEDESLPETRQLLAAQLRGLRGKAAWQTAILADVDRRLGALLDALDEAGLQDSTYVFVSFDHGASGRGSNAPLSGGKGSVQEGGVRVPFLVRGPGVEKGACIRVRASAADLLPTALELAGIAKAPEGTEGGSLVAVLREGQGGKVVRPREEFVVHFPHYDLGYAPASAIWLGQHKLVHHYADDSVQLFDLAADPGERRNLAASQPELAKDLRARLESYLRSIDAAMPTRAAGEPGQQNGGQQEGGQQDGGQQDGGRQGGGRKR